MKIVAPIFFPLNMPDERVPYDLEIPVQNHMLIECGLLYVLFFSYKLNTTDSSLLYHETI